jgi:hypothetical protein
VNRYYSQFFDSELNWNCQYLLEKKMKVFVLTFLLVGCVSGMMFPVLDMDTLAEVVAEHTNQSTRSLAFHPLRKIHQSRTIPVLNQSAIDELIDVAESICGPSESIYPREIKEHWPQAWLESRFPMTFVLRIYLPAPDGTPLFPIIKTFGDFNSSLVRNSEGRYAFLNERSTSFEFLNGTTTPPVFDQALFTFRRDCDTAPVELCGIDTALGGTGTFGNAPGITEGMPIFKNILNKEGLMTADTFTTSVPSAGTGADAGVGANYYNVLTDATTNEVGIEIDSLFNLVNPANGEVLLIGYQKTITGPQPIPALPI